MHFLFIVLQNSSITLAGRILQIYYYFDFFLITSCQNPYVNLRKITLQYTKNTDLTNLQL